MRIVLLFCSGALIADVDVVAAGRDVEARLVTLRNLPGARGVAVQSVNPCGGVVVAGGIAAQCIHPESAILLSCGSGVERGDAVCRIEARADIGIQRQIARSGVLVSRLVKQKSIGADGSIVAATQVVLERVLPGSGVAATRSVVLERAIPEGGVAVPVVVLKRECPRQAVFSDPVVLSSRTPAPIAVFWLPVVLSSSTNAPVPVL